MLKTALDYSFAKFNKVIDIIEYSDEDYQKFLTGKTEVFDGKNRG